MEKLEIIVEGETYTYVRTRNQMPVSIYKGENSFLRIGPPKLIEKEVMYHKRLLDFGFPLAQIIAEGKYEDQKYFIEVSLGEFHFGQICVEDFAQNGFVSESIFRNLLEMTKKYAKAQLDTISSSGKFNPEEFKKLILFETILEEAPHLAEKSRRCMEKVEEHIASLPTVITHGDFNPHNIFPKGVIDWERTTVAPAGYDLATNISQIFFFPHAGEYEFMGKY
ncbi:MAG: aminoglycoside phosphotransferase family protein, partial [Candidatus Pacebacteria bacterium]|nr:aminoglycoside phosphotransferase family protein [Candidatus Paceibacterota bacterium]